MVGVGAGMLALIVGLLLLGPLAFMFAWNFAAPVFWVGAPHITFFNALCVVVGLHTLQRVASTKKN